MSSNSDLLALVFIQPAKDNADAMHFAADEYGSNSVVNNTYQMVGRSISTCVNHKKQIGMLTIAGHGSKGAFHIGFDRVTVNSITPGHEFYKANVYLPLVQLIPYFHPSAKIDLQQCGCAWEEEGRDLIKRMSHLWKRPVIGFSSNISFTNKGIEYDALGRFTVCVNQVCVFP